MYSKWQERVGNIEEGIRFLELCGFERDDGGKFMFLPAHKVDMPALVSADTVLNSAITNPYFGLLSKWRIDIVARVTELIPIVQEILN